MRDIWKSPRATSRNWPLTPSSTRRIRRFWAAAAWTARFIARRARNWWGNAALIGRCPTGEARITGGYNLPAKHVIHTVGPVWNGGSHGEDGLLESCYRNSLALARKAGVKTIAFPAISTGIYRFPLDRAARIAVAAVVDELDRDRGSIEKVIFCTFGAEATEAFRLALKDAGQ